ncbi:serine hydrolase domain-containing protein [Thalassotalea sp. PS06]|uniref:serine hydrolase domain-containing protein n=1 Tax=Thalassotalea sp. PS06 TaxID=2594005 RepID=UPI001162C909|nr:serine hydrolase domain-containing protein [Thalassotalea sp. PS06]QDP01412.1 beta-lactamase family protein [Thalassotalea sp. PS06]
MRIARLIVLIGWVSTFFIGVTGATQTEQSDAVSDLTSEIDRAVAPYVAAGDFMGVVAVQRSEEPPLILSYGLASIELGVPHRPAGRFLIGSISKQFTAVAILLLEQEGRLKTSDLIKLYLPDFKPGEPITIEQLLTHTSGVADVYSLKRFGETGGKGGSFSDVIQDLGEMPLTHPPGSTYAYSNGGYSLLAAIIEHVSGMTYGDYLADRIFKPLGMASTSDDRQVPAVRNRVPGYDPWGRHDLVRTVPMAEAYSKGSGSLWSSAADLLTWNNALHGGRLLSGASYAKLMHDYGHAYGYGVSVFKRFSRDVISHDGRVSGYASDTARYLNEQTTVVILSNVQSVARDDIRRAVAAIVFDELPPKPEVRIFAERPLDPLVDFVGEYSFGPGFKVTILESNGRLLARANQGADSELVPMSDGTWFSRMLYATVRFERGDRGRVNMLVWGRGDQAPIGTRIR